MIILRTLGTLVKIGNVSNPIITRLGISQFWYHHWYSDSIFSNILHQNKFLEMSIKFYLDYGTRYIPNIYFNSYWFGRFGVNYKTYANIMTIRNKLFYRKYFTTEKPNFNLEVKITYTKRNFSGEYFPFRIWLFRYVGWFIISIQRFKPVKITQKKKKSKFFREEYSLALASVTSVHKKLNLQKFLIKRLKLVLALILNRATSHHTYYHF